MTNDNQPSVIILGASFLQVPLIEAARRLGVRSIVVDMDPDAVGRDIADEFHCISTLDTDAIMDLARRVKPSGITTTATDAPMKVVAAVAAELGLPAITPEAALACTDKFVMAKAFEAAGVPHPEYRLVNSFADAEAAAASIGFPLILKPTDSSGSRGVVIVEDPSELQDAYEYAQLYSRGGQVIAEEFLVGTEISLEMFHDRERMHVVVVTDKYTSGAPHFVELGHSQPSELPEDILDAARAVAIAASEAVGIHRGPGHAELMLTRRGPVMIEIGARLGGDCVTSHLAPLSTGVDLVGLVIKNAVDMPFEVPTPEGTPCAVRFMEAPEGKLSAVHGIPDAQAMPGVVLVDLVKPLGHVGAGTLSSADRLGHVIAYGATQEEARTRCTEALNHIAMEVA